MAQKADFDALSDRFLAGLAEIAADLKDLRDQVVPRPGLSEADEQAIFDTFESAISRLEVLGEDAPDEEEG